MRALRRALRRVVRRRRFGVALRRRRQPFFAAKLRLRETFARALRRVVVRRRRFGVALRRFVVRRRRFGVARRAVPARRRRAQPFLAAALRLRETLALALRRVVVRRRRFGVARLVVRFAVVFLRRRFGAAARVVVRFRRRVVVLAFAVRRRRRFHPFDAAVEWRALSPGQELRRARRRLGAALRRFGLPRRSAARAFRRLRKEARFCAADWRFPLILLFLRVDAGVAFFLAERTFFLKARFCSSLSRLFAIER